MIEKLLSTIGFLGHWVLHHELKAYNVHNVLQHVGGLPSHRLFPALAIPEALHLPFNSARPLGMASEEARLLVPLSGINFWTFTSFSDKKKTLNFALRRRFQWAQTFQQSWHRCLYWQDMKLPLRRPR
jgi:hypothetical protein